MDRRAAGALLALAACIASSAAAPTVNNQTALDLYDATSEGCYYNFQHYGEGDRIMTNEPCLNCTCHNRMLMCYLRVCPFTKPIGQDCTVEKRADQCCPIVTCPDVPVDLLTSTSTSSPAEYGATGLGKLDKYGCSINGKYFPEGSKVPPTPNKPCEHCYCIRNMTTCVMQECTLHVDGCTPIYHKDVCCPVRYSCDHPEDEMPLLDDMSTTVRPTPGFLLTTTTLSPVTQMSQDCVHNDEIFPDGTSIKTEKACEHCYCMKGDIVCVVQECGTPMENEGKNCTSQPPREGQCCPDTYICEGDEMTTELSLDYTTGPSDDILTTLIPPRRVIDEGSGYRKEEESVGILPSNEPEVEGSGDDFATLEPSKETEKETPSLIDEKFSSTEDMVGVDTTSQSNIKIEKSTTEPDSSLNTVPSDITEPSDIYGPKLTTVSDVKETSQETEQTHAEINYTTASPKDKEEEVSIQTTESAFRKEDESRPLDTTTEKSPEEYTTALYEPTKIPKLDTEQEEPLVTLSETEATTSSLLEFSQTEMVTEISTITTSDKSVKEPSISFDHTSQEPSITREPDQTETTTLNAQENEIEDISTTPSQGRIPGEGDCLQNGVTYKNESAVPSNNNCLTDCKCISSIIKCDPIICSPPPEYMSNCVPTYESLESCCPTYVCEGSKETIPPQPHSQMSETTSSTPTPQVECQGDQCEVHKIDKSSTPVPSYDCESADCVNKPGVFPEPSDCGTEGCGGIIQTPIQTDVQPECGSEDCSGIIQTPIQTDVQPECGSEDCSGIIQTPIQTDVQPECGTEDCGGVILPHEVSPVPSDSCSDSECQQRPIEKEDSIQPCDGDNCKIPPVQTCQNEEECKKINTPKIESPCDGESCKIVPTECKDEACKVPPDTILPSCQGENCESKDKQEQECFDEECKKTNIPDSTGKLPIECSGDDCLSQPDNTEIFGTESSIPTEEKVTEITLTATELSHPLSTITPEQDYSHTSEIIQETTDKGIDLTELEETQAPSLFSSEKPLSDSDEDLEKTDKPSTVLPLMQTTVHVPTAETTSATDLNSQTDSKQELEFITTSAPSQKTEDIEAFDTTKIDDLITKLPEIAQTTEILEQTEEVTEKAKLPEEESLQEGTPKPEQPTEIYTDNEDVTKSPTLSSESKPETEVTEPADFETSAQPSTEQPSKPILDITSVDQQYTKEPEIGSGEETTESLIIPTEEIEQSPDTELPKKEDEKEDEETSVTPIKTSNKDKDITTSLPEILEMSTEESRLGTSATSEIYTTLGNDVDVSTESHDKKIETPGPQTQEPTLQTTSISESHVSSEDPHKLDIETTVKSDVGVTATQPSISMDTDTSDTEKPLIDKQNLPDLPSEEIYTDQPEIDTEEPSLITKQDEVIHQEPVEPESPDFIPVHPTVSDKLESDLIDRNTTPESISDIMVTTEGKLHLTTPEVKTEKSVPEIEDISITTPEVIKEQYDHEKSTEASLEILPTDNRKYNQDTTDIFEPVTKVDELITRHPGDEKITVSPASHEPSTPKSSMEEESYGTTPGESLSTDNQEVIRTEMPESHVKETDSGEKLTSVPEITTDKLKPVQSEETQTQPSDLLEPKPTESHPPSVAVEMELTTPEHNLETSTKMVPESTSEPNYEKVETTPDMIELVEHNEMFDVSTPPSSISDSGTTISAGTEKLDEKLTTEKLVTSEMEAEPETTTTSSISSESDTEDKIKDETSTKQPYLTTDRQITTEQLLENKPEIDMATFKPEVIQTLGTSTEAVKADKDYSTQLPDITDLEHQTLSSEIPTVIPEVTKTDIDQHTTVGPEASVTESKVEFDVGSGTEEPEITEMEVQPDVLLPSTKKPEIEQEPIFEPESSTTVSEEPSIDEQSVIDKTIESKAPDVPIIENEVIPEQENIKPTIIPEVQKETTAVKETVTEESLTETDNTSDQEFTTENPTVSETIKEAEMESSTEQKLMPELDIISSKPESPFTEKESTSVQEFVTKEPELETPNLESSTILSDLPVSEDKFQLQPSSEQPDTIETEQDIALDGKSSTELPITPDMEQEMESPGYTEKIKTEEETTTEKVESYIDTNKETTVKNPETSDTDNEISFEASTILPEVEHKLSTEASITEQPTSSIEQEIINEPATESMILTETDNVPVEPASVTEKSDQLPEESETGQKPTTQEPQITEIEKESSTVKTEETTTILPEQVSETTKYDISDDHFVPEISTKKPEISVGTITEHITEPSTDKPDISSLDNEVTSVEPITGAPITSVTEHSVVIEPEIVTTKPEEAEIHDKDSSPSSEKPIDEHEITDKVTIVPVADEYTRYDDKEKDTTTKSEHEVEKLTTISDLDSTPSSTEKVKLPDELTEATPEIHDESKQDEDITKHTTPEYTPKDETTVSETEKPSILVDEIPVQTKPETERPIDLTKDTTAPEEEFLTVTSKATTPKIEIESSTHSENFDKITKPHEIPEETSSMAPPDIPKPGFNEVHGTDDLPGPEEESHFAPSATGGYGQEPDYEDENQPFGPGTCRYGGKVYVSAQQIPRDDPCDFCFCFRSDIICLQQSCPPPIHGCHEEPIQGFCCPRYECPVSMASTLNVTTTTTTTTTTLPPHFLPHAYQGAVQRRGCQIKGHTYKVGEVVRASSGPCLHCTCGGDGQMKCDPKVCTPEPMLRQMIAAAVSAKRRR